MADDAFTDLFEHVREVQLQCWQHSPERSFVSLCFAQSLDGCLAWSAGQQTHLSQAESLVITHRLRSMHQGIVVGAGTLRCGDPLLNVRYVQGPSPRPVILDTHARSTIEARLFKDQLQRPILATGNSHNEAAQREIFRPWADLLALPLRDGRVDLYALLPALRLKGLATLMVEGGGQVISSFLAAQLCDFLVINITPFILGQQDAVRYSMPLSKWLHLESMGSSVLRGEVWLWGRPIWRKSLPTHAHASEQSRDAHG